MKNVAILLPGIIENIYLEYINEIRKLENTEDIKFYFSEYLMTLKEGIKHMAIQRHKE